MRMRHARPRDTERTTLPAPTRPLRPARHRLTWYLLAVGLSALAFVLMALLWPLMEHSVFFLFLAAVSISALYGGLGPGLTATALSAAASNFLVLEPYHTPFGDPEGVLRVAIFLATGVLISWLADGH